MYIKQRVMTSEEKKEYQREYYHSVIKKDPIRIQKRNERNKEYRKKNLEYFSSYGKKYRKENKEYFQEYNKQYREL